MENKKIDKVYYEGMCCECDRDEHIVVSDTKSLEIMANQMCGCGCFVWFRRME